MLTEADSHLGLANRLLARGARRVCLAFPIAGRDGGSLPRDRAGRSRSPDADRAQARAHFRIGAQETCVLVFGGSLGARSINLAAVEAFAGMSGSRPVRRCSHRQRGRRDYPELAARALARRV